MNPRIPTISRIHPSHFAAVCVFILCMRLPRVTLATICINYNNAAKKKKAFIPSFAFCERRCRVVKNQLNMKKLFNFADIKDIPDGYVYASPQKRAWYLWTLFFGFITGDLNPIHVNFFTSTSYKSTLGGLARHGISTIAEAESFIFKIFKFEVPTEIIALGYSHISYLKPVNIGNKIVYSYKLLSKTIKEKRNYAQCVWYVSGKNDKDLEVFNAEWMVRYSTIELNIVKAQAYPMGWLLSRPIEVSGTPLSLLGWRLIRFVCLGIIVYLFAHAWLA